MQAQSNQTMKSIDNSELENKQAIILAMMAAIASDELGIKKMKNIVLCILLATASLYPQKAQSSNVVEFLLTLIRLYNSEVGMIARQLISGENNSKALLNAIKMSVDSKLQSNTNFKELRDSFINKSKMGNLRMNVTSPTLGVKLKVGGMAPNACVRNKNSNIVRSIATKCKSCSFLS